MLYIIALALSAVYPVRMGCVISKNENDFDAIGGNKALSIHQDEDALDEVRIVVSTLHHDLPLSPLVSAALRGIRLLETENGAT